MIGLSQKKARSLLAQFGPNVISETEKSSLVMKFLRQFADATVIILIIGASIALFVGLYQGHASELTDALLIFAIVIINAIIGFVQEYKSEKAVEALKKLTTPHAKVFRDGRETVVDASDIVPGDVILLEAGDKIPADATVIESNSLQIDESVLTGESVPVNKDARSRKQESRLLSMGTSVVNGNGKAFVLHTGMRTTFGKIAHLTGTTKKDKSPLQMEMQRIGIFIGKIAILISLFLFVVGVYLQELTFIESLIFAVAVSVAVVPEGLPAIITITLALGMQRLAKKKALVKQLSSVETLGATTVICTDKTGTLTQNQMVVTKALLGTSETLDITGIGYDPSDGAVSGAKKEKMSLRHMMLIAENCNNARIWKEKNTWTVFGDPTEAALKTFAAKVRQKLRLSLPKYQKVSEHPFDSIRKRMSVVMRAGSKYLTLAKGSPEDILKMCTHVMAGSRKMPITAAHKKRILAHYQSFGHQGLRVLAYAFRQSTKAPGTEKQTESKLCFVGLTGLLDPPRAEVPHAVAACREAGIRIIIITGDYGPTALAVGEKIGLNPKRTPLFTGKELDGMNDRELSKLLKKHHDAIFARVSPEHKLRIVSALKAQNEVVAVTGDGVNDAPALKRSDIGVAMGITGTEVSKEASNMVLTDDSFASIVSAVHEGRVVYDNLRKFIWYILSCNVGEIMVIIGAIIMDLPVPITATLLLAVNIGTDLFPALALGLEKSEANIMRRVPRKPDQSVLNHAFIARMSFIGFLVASVVLGVFWFFLQYDPAKAVTAAFAALVMTQIFNALNARSETASILRLGINPSMIAALAASTALMIGIIHAPVISQLFRTQPLNAYQWTVIIAASSIILLAEEIRKVTAGLLASATRKQVPAIFRPAPQPRKFQF